MNGGSKISSKPSSTGQQFGAGVGRQGAFQPGKPGIAQPSHVRQSSPKLSAPPACSPQQQKKTIQPKMPGTPSIVPPRPTTGSPSGIIQANLIGGTRALQARLAARHAPVEPSDAQPYRVAPRTAANNESHREKGATIQTKAHGKTQAFKVALQPKSGGMPIPDEVRKKMETAFGADFSDVRVHVGPEASSIGAIAYTWGTNIHFAPGHYNPWSIQGQKLLGHELWHVLQQKSGRVKNPFGAGVAIVQDHALEAEADRMGIKAAMAPMAQASEK